MAVLPAITDLLSSVRLVDQRFQLVSRQEYSRTASGVTIGRDMGPSLWQASFTTTPMYHDESMSVEAKLNSLNGLTRGFYAGDIRRKYPRMYPTGVFNDTGSISSINANGRMLSFTGLPANFKISAGDYMEYDYGSGNQLRALLQVVGDVTASGSGVANNIEFRPFIPVGTVVATAVRFKTPRALFTLTPEGVEQTIVEGCFTQLSFTAMQSFLR